MERADLMNLKTPVLAFVIASVFTTACNRENDPDIDLEMKDEGAIEQASETAPANPRFDIYASVRLDTDLSQLSDNQKIMLGSMSCSGCRCGVTAMNCWTALKTQKPASLPFITTGPGTAWLLTSRSWRAMAPVRRVRVFTPRT
jgi:hypothetical protein